MSFDLRYFTQLCRQCVADALYFENWAFSKSALALKETIYTKAADEGMNRFSRIIVQTLGVGEIQSMLKMVGVTIGLQHTL